MSSRYGYSGLMGGIQQLMGNQYPYVAPTDRRPARVQLTERLKRNEDQIAQLTAANDELRAALAGLDEHPAIEQISDVLRKLL